MTDNHTIYSGKMKAADLISADWRLLSIFERLDIKLGFGEATIDEICSRYNLSSELFLMICNIYSFNSYRPKAEKLKKEDLPHILSYLRASHKHYMNNWFPRLHNNIHTMMEEYEDTNSYVLNKFFDDYDTEIKKHFEYEEFSVFPYIESLLDGSSEAVYKISNFEDNHTNVEEKLNDLKNIIIKYLPGTYTSNIRMKVLNEIFKIESDLRKHTLVENRLLIPLVTKLEKNNGRE
jgi:regulator of cell morphogenesis and NO signaling